MMPALLFLFQFFLVALLLCAFLALFFIIVAAFKKGVPFVPVNAALTTKITEALALTSDSVLYDLGAGDGRVLFSAEASEPKASYTGIEKAPVPYFLAQLRKILSPHSHIRFAREDLFAADIHDATHVFLYLFPSYMEKLLPKLQSECRKGTRIVACDFPFSGLTEKELHTVSFGKNSKKLYVYEL